MSLPAVALAAGKLMKLGPSQLTQAVNLAVNDHIPMAQTRVQTLSDWKGLADAEAARNAVFATALARGDQLRLGGCGGCGSLMVTERFTLRAQRCHHCASPLQAH